MNQQDAKNILEMKDFLESLEKIVIGFKNTTDSISTRLTAVNERLAKLENSVQVLDSKVNVNDTSNMVNEVSKDFADVRQTLNEHMATTKKLEDSIREVESTLSKEISQVKVLIAGPEADKKNKK